jgi:hypothetical protein
VPAKSKTNTADEELPPEPDPEPPAAVDYSSLVALLLELTTRGPLALRQEQSRADVMDLLREVEADLGVVGVVPPPRDHVADASP